MSYRLKKKNQHNGHAVDKHGGVSPAASEAQRLQIVTKFMKPSSRSLFHIIKRFNQFPRMMRVVGVDKALRLSHIYVFGEITM